MEFSLLWRTSFGRHNDRRFVEKIDFWRDLFPGTMQEHLANLSPGEKFQQSFAPGELVPEYSDKNLITFPRNLFADRRYGGPVKPVAGRFYPKSYAWKPLRTFPENHTPFRLLQETDTTLRGDTNHPLAAFPLVIEVTMVEQLKTITQRGGSINDIAELLTSYGPGMQQPCGAFYEDIYKIYPLKRDNQGDDGQFYQAPRFVHHLDKIARSHVQQIYERQLSPGMKILDLMSSWQSHLPETLTDCQVTGIGLNREELKKNEQLTDYRVHDLNKKPVLPCQDHSFDAVVCTVSMEYLIHPREIMAEVARILCPAGIFIVILSDRWFPGKQIEQWTDLHPFERQGFVLQYFLNEDSFCELETETIRGYPRPAEDKYSDRKSLSDPLFVVRGRKTG